MKKEPPNTRSSNNTNCREEATEASPRVAKRPRSDRGGGGGGGVESSHAGVSQGATERRVLRYKYLAVKNLISDERENLTGDVLDKFNDVIGQVESLHNQVQKPREQVADAEALLDIANTIVDSIRAQSNDGITPSDFITSLLRQFPPQTAEMSTDNLRNSMDWGKIGHSVSHIFMKANGCSTMLGPMNIEIKQKQRRAVQRKRTRPSESSRPEELDDDTEEKTDTDKNMATMFNILRRKRTAMLEQLILNRNSFAQTVENLFALSFLVKDGRVEIRVDNNGRHLVLPKNAPPAAAIASGDVSYSHFVFRLDFQDWKLMLDYVQNGEELMPHRTQVDLASNSQEETVPLDSQNAAPTTPIRKLCRNRGLVIQEESVVEESPETNDVGDKAYAIRMGKRKVT